MFGLLETTLRQQRSSASGARGQYPHRYGDRPGARARQWFHASGF